MCASTAFLRVGDAEKLVLKDVSMVIPGDGKVTLRSLLGDEKVLENTVLDHVDLEKHVIVLRPG